MTTIADQLEATEQYKRNLEKIEALAVWVRTTNTSASAPDILALLLTCYIGPRHYPTPS